MGGVKRDQLERLVREGQRTEVDHRIGFNPKRANTVDAAVRTVGDVEGFGPDVAKHYVRVLTIGPHHPTAAARVKHAPRHNAPASAQNVASPP